MPKMIISADWHIRNTRPRCRTDEDWMLTQKNALNQIRRYANDKEVPVFVVGDLFHTVGDTSMQCVTLIQNMARRLRKGLYILCGNHDLPFHSSENIERSGVGVLLSSNKIERIKDWFIDNEVEDYSAEDFDCDTSDAEIVFKHVLCFPDMKSMPPNVNAMCAKDLLEEYPSAKWIFTGDYHRNFHYEKKGRHVVNSGCLLRQASDMKDYQTGFYYVDTDKNIVEFVPIIDSDSFIDDSYIIKEKEKIGRIEEFADSVTKVKKLSLDFLDNVEKSLMEQDFSDDLKDVVKELCGV